MPAVGIPGNRVHFDVPQQYGCDHDANVGDDRECRDEAGRAAATSNRVPNLDFWPPVGAHSQPCKDKAAEARPQRQGCRDKAAKARLQSQGCQGKGREGRL